MALEIHGNQATMNLENILLINIQSSMYFKDLYRLKTYHEVLDEICHQVKYIERMKEPQESEAVISHSCAPWVPNAGKTVSTAFCLLFKLFTLKLTHKQMNGMLSHTNSHVRALGFLYLRYTSPPKKLWDWYEPFLEDDDEVVVSPKAKPYTTATMLREFIKEQRFADTIFPRIPVPIQKDMLQKLKEHDIEVAQEYAEQGYTDYGENEEKSEKGRLDDRDRGIDRHGDRRQRDRRDDKGHRDRHSRSNSRSRSRSRSRSKESRRYYDRDRRRSRSRSRSHERHDSYKDRDYRARERGRDRRRSRSSSRSPQRAKYARRSRSRSRSRSISPKRRSDSRDRSPTRSFSQSKPVTNNNSAQQYAALQKLKALYGATTSTKIDDSGTSKKDSMSGDTILLGSFSR